MVLGAIEVVGVSGALSSERVALPGPPGLAFEIPRMMFDAEHKFVDLPSGARIHYVDEGKGETLLFLHGNPSWSFQSRDLIRGLRGSYRYVALDYPGFGLSTAPAGFGFTPLEQSRVVEEFIDQLGLRGMTLVMQDWGGPIGLGLPERRPELVHRVILGGTWTWQTSTSEPRGVFSLVAGGPVGEFVQMNFNGLASLALRQSIVRGLPPLSPLFTCVRFSRSTAAASRPSTRDKSPPRPATSRSLKLACLVWRTSRRSSFGHSKTQGFPAAPWRGSKDLPEPQNDRVPQRESLLLRR